MNRIFIAGIVGGIVMFIWSSIAHMLLPLGEVGVQELPNQPASFAALEANIPEAGLYMLPGFGLGPNPTSAQTHEAMKHMDERAALYPSGFLMYFPKGARPMMMGRWLGIEFATELVESLLVVWLLSLTRLTTFGARLGFVTVAGILAAIATNVSYWNWYGFPANYTAAYIFTQVVGFICVGIVAGLILKNQPTPPMRDR
ncbi:MAG TPA: hypothetical protein VGG02_13590 [Chthoniobacterales bacterium]|jgi:hypothetical protein